MLEAEKSKKLKKGQKKRQSRKKTQCSNFTISNLVVEGELKSPLRQLVPNSKGAMEIDKDVAKSFAAKFPQATQEESAEEEEPRS